ncbi:MAG: hypothetical protein GYB53_21230 [Rhodobacteraceae bacterium]|nr:hypothetical protein [Paracoccaceae bacterium]MBR9819747.1 hypothetical protein [Paracoccaceae bacterium]
MSPTRRGRLLRLAGGLLLLAALGFLARTLVAQWHEVRALWPGPRLLVPLLGLGLAYGGALFLLAESWHRILQAQVLQTGAKVPRHRSYLSQTATQVARYLPGNVAHILGRALWLRGSGLSDAALARATVTELLVTPTGALLALALLAPLLPAEVIAPLPPALRLLPLSLALVALLLAPRVGPFRSLARRLCLPLLLSALFMLGLGAGFAVVCALLGPVPVVPAMVAGLLAWIIGYATPGVPGGLGLREAALVALLSAAGQDRDLALLASLLFRLVTTVGELAMFAAGWGLARLLRAVPAERADRR